MYMPCKVARIYSLFTISSYNMDKKAPTTAHLSKLEDVLGEINGIEQDVAQIVETLPASNNTVLNGKFQL